MASTTTTNNNNKKKQRRHVLSEEEYTSTLEGIVERDYFPGLPELRKQAAVLDRRSVQDFKGAVQVRRAARQLQQHEEALADADREQERTTAAIRQEARPLHRETITGFHARVTSEDNHEFDSVQAEQIQQQRDRLNQVYAPKVPLLKASADEEKYMLASDEFNVPYQRIEAPKCAKRDNGFFFSPQIKENAESGHPNLLTNDDDADLKLMPPPTAKITKRDLVEYVPKHTLEKRIEPSQTRFPTTTAIMAVRPPPTINDDSTTTDYSTDASTDLDSISQPRSIEEERNSFAKRKAREQETLVAMTPLIIPRGGDADASPITTWGTVNSTPMVVAGGSEFSMPTDSERDERARKAEARMMQRTKVAASARKKQKRSKSSSLLPNRAHSLTPAARSLLRIKSSTRSLSSSVRSGSALASALRTSYTTPLRQNSSRRRSAAAAATPKVTKGVDVVPKIRKPTESVSITDGLLKLS